MAELVEGSRLIVSHPTKKTRRPSKLRSLAWVIKNHRDFLTFRGEKPRYLFDERGLLPKRYWRNKQWMDRHIVQPTIRERMRWPSYKLTGEALPESLRVDNKLF